MDMSQLPEYDSVDVSVLHTVQYIFWLTKDLHIALQMFTSTQSYAGSHSMAGSVLRSKMRSLRQGKAEESKGEEKPKLVLSFCTLLGDCVSL